MKLSRLVVLFLLIADIIVFFTMQNDFDENGRWALVGFALLLAIVWVYLGDTAKAAKPVQKKRNVQQVVEETTEPDLSLDLDLLLEMERELVLGLFLDDERQGDGERDEGQQRDCQHDRRNIGLGGEARALHGRE